jgi:uncharacterized protein (TIGR04255 family)
VVAPSRRFNRQQTTAAWTCTVRHVVRPNDLAEYADPPVDEIVVGVLLQATPGYSDMMPLIMRDGLRDLGYSTYSIQPPYLVDDEHPDRPIERPKQPRLEMVQVASNRSWLGTEDDQWIAQVQSDAVLSNWKRSPSMHTYPRFEALLDRFGAVVRAWAGAAVAVGLILPEVKQVEVTYTNWIEGWPMDEWFRPAQNARLSGRHAVPVPDASSWSASHTIHDSDSKQIGRLRLDCQPTVRLSDQQWSEGTQFSLRTRFAVSCAPIDAQINDVAEIGRETIVQAFTDLTTDEAHNRWHRSK